MRSYSCISATMKILGNKYLHSSLNLDKTDLSQSYCFYVVNMNQYTLQQTQTRYAISEEKLSVAEIINPSSHVSISHSITLNC